MPDTPLHKSRDPLEPPASVTPAALPYVELDVTSNFDFLRGASHPDELVYTAARLGYRAIGIADRNTLAGVVRAHVAAKQCGMKLVVGARLTFPDAPDLLVFCPDRGAYGRLCRLITIGKRRVEKGCFDLRFDEFLEHADGLLVVADVQPTVLASRESPETLADAMRPVHRLRERFGDDLSLLVHLLGEYDHGLHLDRMSRLSSRLRVPLLAGNAVHYHDPARRPLQDILVCIREGCTIEQAGRRLFPSAERYLKSPDQMHRLFAASPSAIRRALDVAERCRFSLDELKYEYPDELVPPGLTPLQYLVRLTWEGAAERYPAGIPEKVRTQIEHELTLIEQLKYEAYFLTVYDLVRFARSRGILCQGRGSAANSAVCYCIGVTSVDPARIDLLFERFVSAARNEPPDIDIDFEHERREEVIQYVYQKYGRERAGMTATLITYRGRSAVREVGKALGLTLDVVDSLARRLDWWHKGTPTESQLRESGCDPTNPTMRRLVSLVSELLGFPRHLGQHTGGMVMTRGPLCELVPIENASMPDRTVIEWDKDDIDELGLLKVDLLGLGMLSLISRAFALMGPDEPMQLHSAPPEDQLVYDMICDADTIGVFQIESRAQMSMLPRLRPRCFYDLVIEVAIVRPGPIQGNMVHPYLRRRSGEETVSYPSEALREVLHKTLGVPLFQEQAMKIAMVAAGFSAEEADQLRRAMAAWRRTDKLLLFRDKIISGMLANGYTRDFAEQCFNQIKGFGEYGFPESHSASFALLVYVSCWLKRHRPAHFYCALLNSQPMGFYAPAQIVRDAREHAVVVRPVDVRFSEWDCTLEARDASEVGSPDDANIRHDWGRSAPALRLGFRQVKGLSRDDMERLVKTRDELGGFSSIEQVQRAVGLGKPVMRRLAEADAFRSLSRTRRPAVWETLPLDNVERPLFAAEDNDLVPASLPTMPIGQEVLTDYTTTGLSLKRHPVSLVRGPLTELKVLPASRAVALPTGKVVRVCGLVLVRQRPGTASGVVFITLEDETGVVNLIVRPKVYERFRAAARHAALLQCDGIIERQGQVVHVMARRLSDRSDLLRGASFHSRDFH